MKPFNRLNIDYRQEASKLALEPLIDFHSHINGQKAARVYKEVAALYGVERVFSMTQLKDLDAVRAVLGEKVEFIAVPDFLSADKVFSHGVDFIEKIKLFHKQGSRIVKFWSAPRGIDIGLQSGVPDLLRINSKHRLQAMELAADLGMAIMAHIADPDTWFKTKYQDTSVYGTKLAQYEHLDLLLEKFPVNWILAHMGGYPEDLAFLDGLLEKHTNLYLDTSATKWMVRELSRYSPERTLRFFSRWEKRLLFGSDIVTSDEHLVRKGASASELDDSRDAFELYASRYWALRTLFQTTYQGESPIADPDLALLEPDRYSELDAPRLNGMSLPKELLKSIYLENAKQLFP